PTFPLLAVLFGTALARIDGEILRHYFRKLLGAAVGGIAVIGFGAIVLGLQLGLKPPAIVADLAMVCGAMLIARTGFRGSWVTAARSVAVIGLVVMPVIY